MIDLMRAGFRVLLAFQLILFNAIVIAPIMLIFYNDRFSREWASFMREIRR